MSSNDRPPRRFNIIEGRLQSSNYYPEKRKMNRSYLKQYTRKRESTDLSKLVQMRQKRALALLDAFVVPFTQMNVSGDGNCFYRALYRVSKEHKDPTVLEKVFTILNADKTRMKDEESGQAALRAAVARIIENQSSKPEGIYERLRDAAELPKDEQILFNMLVSEASHGVMPIYRRIKSYTRKNTGKTNFYKNLSNAVRRNREYASEADYYTVKDLLEAGGIAMISTHKMPTTNRVDGKPALYLRRINENHYNYWREN